MQEREKLRCILNGNPQGLTERELVEKYAKLFNNEIIDPLMFTTLHEPVMLTKMNELGEKVFFPNRKQVIHLKNFLLIQKKSMIVVQSNTRNSFILFSF